MKTFAKFLLLFSIISTKASNIASAESAEIAYHGYSQETENEDLIETTPKPKLIANENNGDEIIEEQGRGRGLADSEYADYSKQDHHVEFRKRAKPLKNIFMGIYKNYKSTYVGDKTSLEYKQRVRERLKTETPMDSRATTEKVQSEMEDVKEEEEEGDERGEKFNSALRNLSLDSGVADQVIANEADTMAESSVSSETGESDSQDTVRVSLLSGEAIKDINSDSTHYSAGSKLNRKRRRRKQKTRKRIKKIRKRLKIPPPAGGDDPLIFAEKNAYGYNVGPGLNLSLDMSNDIVNVHMDSSNLREIFDGQWLSDNSVEGRGKKYDMMTKVLPLFILPFLIQSAIVPFLVTKLKLLIVKSILVGKLAIFLLIISAIKNSNKAMQSYELAPSYWAGEPSRRSELAAAASSAAYNGYSGYNGYNGYRVEGKPTTWIN